ncbi:MAG: hypothetical protein A2402_03780 [Candidatus Staskawiczbacteria bacterium RIFOXYC1_FULL_37_43]|nr:MAG: hypothetical protein A2813_01490 [Candidatus Staskawiczbacteria bacterium RIFCSPHIGHO2_01_FULL_37_17]OGZ72072.1 MAG: hypothetical protein A2891_01515 [Candidatus Staskawiczbacteria bacterium RIFCSPLOWO2_01_FULL_37_19]OGZ75762.1 MAG: hypothetical protein A2205_02700 [Candidatus Staskawiczbacteria bacterium RIFOXYA1_FULL_37_15]OGZ77187.1 MAG: hypothetical protein A2280_02105 [Candidatus Staskawiczbacteria bacterium RIFOXYA12_FULL_37_10]OGZ80652.1 MAG: hypothetical protein A2353_00380 [Can
MNATLFKKNIFLCAVFFLFSVQGAFAANFSDVVNFNVEESFDASGRERVEATLVKTTNKLYFYVEKSWWDSQPHAKQDQILSNLNNLSQEFDNKIYPVLTSVFGSEWKPGVDGDSRITVLFEAMNSNEGGYFRTADEYIKLQIPASNEREMVYLALDRIDDPRLKVFLAHEFMHLITFNQKNKIFGADEEVWLNEARADYSSTILGYDDVYSGSNLQQRVKDFIENPSDSITEWTGTKYDYANVSLFMHYVLDHYGITILSDSLQSKYAGIESINYALRKTGYKESFSEIFTDWTVASVLNNCSFNSKYCYLNEKLKNFRISPALNFLPLTGNVSLSVSNVTKNWQGNWLKFIGGNGDLQLDFSSIKGLEFSVPYIIEDSASSQALKFLQLDENQKGGISIEKFGADYKSLIILPSLQSKLSGFDGAEFTYPFTYKVSIKGSAETEDQDLIQQLLDKIAYLKSEIERLQQGNANGQNFCSELNNNLYYGLLNNEQVKCLQSFLKSQGPDIYSAGYVTGNFLAMTRLAVIRFQEKYASEILAPLGLSSGTGFAGPSTRAKINQILSL